MNEDWHTKECLERCKAENCICPGCTPPSAEQGVTTSSDCPIKTLADLDALISQVKQAHPEWDTLMMPDITMPSTLTYDKVREAVSKLPSQPFVEFPILVVCHVDHLDEVKVVYAHDPKVEVRGTRFVDPKIVYIIKR